MLRKNILNIHTRKIICIFLISVMLANILVVFTSNKVKAGYSEKFADYPGYEALIKKLLEKHPNWEFEILETGLDWNKAIIAESTGYHGKNVVPKTWTDAWKCSCEKKVDEDWRCASTAAVAYYMDPRNSLNEDYVFQFEHLAFDEKNQTKEGVERILKPCDYMQGKVTYYDAEGTKKTLEKTYIDVIMEVAKEYNVSPYHLASRIRQEQGAGSAGSLISGTYVGEKGEYKGLYNFFNVKAFGSTTAEIIKNGLTHAKKQGWTDPEKSIRGGAVLIAQGYIQCGQDTLYLEKFDVVDGGDGFYAYQYMTNVSASKTEGSTIRDTYEEMGLLTADSKIKFRVPVYKNMPQQISTKPGSEKIVTQDIEVTGTDVRIRAGKGTNYPILTYVNKGDKLLRIELDNTKDSAGIYWDKVVLNDGTKGYITREYIKQIELQTNANEAYVVSAYTNFRNGPGTTQTVILELLAPKQKLTVVEKDKYKNVNGEDWYRVQLPDGTYGYVGTGYIKPVETQTTTPETLPETPPQTPPEIKPGEETGDNAGIKGTGFKTIDASTICQPNITVANIKEIATDAIIKNGEEVVENDKTLGTGYTITLGDKTYTIVVLGDVNGDGKISSSDYVRIKNHLLKKVTLTEAQIKAADPNNDTKITSSDYVRIKNFLLKKATISI